MTNTMETWMEFQKETMAKFLEMSSTNSNVDVTFSEELTEEEVTVLNALISIHAGRSPEIKKLYETIPNETLINIINSKCFSDKNRL